MTQCPGMPYKTYMQGWLLRLQLQLWCQTVRPGRQLLPLHPGRWWPRAELPAALLQHPAQEGRGQKPTHGL
jgi:hypothetical protein